MMSIKHQTIYLLRYLRVSISATFLAGSISACSSIDLNAQDISFFRSYGANFTEQGNAVAVRNDHVIATVMQLSNPNAGGMVYPGLLLTNDAGGLISCKKFSALSSTSFLEHVMPNGDGYLLVGITNSHTWISQTDPTGNVLWSKYLEAGNGLRTTDVVAVDDGYLFAGTTYPSSSGYAEIACLKIDMSGNVVWSKQINTDNYQLSTIKLIAKNGDLFLAGSGKLEPSFTDVFLMRLNAAAEPLWTKHFNTTYDDELAAFLMDAQGSLYLVGRNYDIQRDWDIFLIKTDLNGEVLATRHFDSGNGAEKARCATVINDGALAISYDHGSSDGRSPAVVSLNLSDLTINWNKTYAYEPQFTNYVLDIVAASNGGLIMVGDMHVTGKMRDTYLLRTLPNGDAGCFTYDHNLSVVDQTFTESLVSDSSQPLAVTVTPIDVVAIDAPEIVPFTACANIPPSSIFHVVPMPDNDCLSSCYTFLDSSRHGPTEWVWQFENGIPDSHVGSTPPEVCWTEKGSYAVQLTVTSPSGQHTSTQVMTIAPDCPPIIPNVFSPNNDRVNDGFVIRSLPAAFTLTIKDRWGQDIFQSGNASDIWRGKHQQNGNDVPEGVYYYALLDRTSSKRYTGYVQLLR